MCVHMLNKKNFDWGMYAEGARGLAAVPFIGSVDSAPTIALITTVMNLLPPTIN